MKIAIPKEIHAGEKRVAATPDSVKALIKLGFSVSVEKNAGRAASYSDADYSASGAEIVVTPDALWSEADIVLKVCAPEQHPDLKTHETELLREGSTLISFLWPAQNGDLLKQLNERKVTALAIDCVPRISRAQKLDALSSMANIAGYRAVVEAAGHCGRFFNGQITAAGKIPPAIVMVIGAGVAGLAAIAAARGLGAVVRAFDTRAEVRQQIESMGAQFLSLDFEEQGSGQGGYARVMSKEFIAAEMALFMEQAQQVDIIITTALIPGQPAPKLLSAELVKAMKNGGVIVDLAAEQGGNCELTKPNKVVIKHGISIIGYTDLQSRMAAQSSQLYSNNLCHLLSDLTPEKDGNIVIDMDDDVIRGVTVSHQGETTWPPPPLKTPAMVLPVEEASSGPPIVVQKARHRALKTIIAILVIGAVLMGLGSVAPPDFMAHFTVFVLACFIGWQVIWSVTPALHTPLMSVTNAISGIIIIGALLQISSSSWLMVALAVLAVLIAMINITGGFLVTQRMLNMFRTEDKQS